MTRYLIRWVVFGLLLFTVLIILTLALGEQMGSVLLAYSSDRDGNAEIYVADVQRQLSVNMTHNDGTDSQPAFSFDGEWMVYFTQSSEGFYALMNLNSHEITDLPRMGTENAQAVPHWMPDERVIYFSDYQSDITTYYDPVTGETTLSEEPGFASLVADTQNLQRGSYLDEPSPFEPARGVILDEEGIPRLYNLDNPIPTAPTTPVALAPFALSPDEQFLAVSLNFDGDYDIYLVPSWEGDPINVIQSSGLDTQPTWSHDGRYIAFVSTRDGNNEVYVYDTVTQTTSNISRNAARDGDPVWIP